MGGSGVAGAILFFGVFEIIAAPFAGLCVGANGEAGFGIAVFIGGILGGAVLIGFSSIIEHTKSSAQRLDRIEIILLKSKRED